MNNKHTINRLIQRLYRMGVINSNCTVNTKHIFFTGEGALIHEQINKECRGNDADVDSRTR